MWKKNGTIISLHCVRMTTNNNKVMRGGQRNGQRNGQPGQITFTGTKASFNKHKQILLLFFVILS